MESRIGYNTDALDVWFLAEDRLVVDQILGPVHAFGEASLLVFESATTVVVIENLCRLAVNIHGNGLPDICRSELNQPSRSSTCTVQNCFQTFVLVH